MLLVGDLGKAFFVVIMPSENDGNRPFKSFNDALSNFFEAPVVWFRGKYYSWLYVPIHV